MDGYLRQSTASQARLLGPFIEDSDPYIDAATGLTIANTDIKLRANGTTLSNKNSGGGTHQVNGMYSVSWDATDTANVGELKYSVKVAGALQVSGSYVVLEEAVYDALYAASAAGFPSGAKVSTVGDMGDVDPGAVLDFDFSTGTGLGVATTLSGTPELLVKKDNSLTTSQAGVTLAVDINLNGAGANTGLNHARIDTAADAAFYSGGSNFSVIVKAGTVGGVSVVGYVIAEFSIQARSALRPTVAGRTADLTAAGNIGIDLGNVENQDATLALTDTTILDVTTKTGYRLSSTGVADIIDAPLLEPTAVFSWGAATLRGILAWLGALSRNKVTETETTQLLRNDDDDATIGTSTVSDNGTTAVRGKFV